MKKIKLVSNRFDNDTLEISKRGEIVKFEVMVDWTGNEFIIPSEKLREFLKVEVKNGNEKRREGS
jgi:hypothetical protein